MGESSKDIHTHINIIKILTHITRNKYHISQLIKVYEYILNITLFTHMLYR